MPDGFEKVWHVLLEWDKTRTGHRTVRFSGIFCAVRNSVGGRAEKDDSNGLSWNKIQDPFPIAYCGLGWLSLGPLFVRTQQGGAYDVRNGS